MEGGKLGGKATDPLEEAEEGGSNLATLNGSTILYKLGYFLIGSNCQNKLSFLRQELYFNFIKNFFLIRGL